MEESAYKCVKKFGVQNCMRKSKIYYMILIYRQIFGSAMELIRFLQRQWCYGNENISKRL